MPKLEAVEDRFFRYANKRGPDDCWPWTGALSKQGRGRLNIRRKAVLAHRISYELHKGPIGEGLCVCHTCDNPQCVNPAHLFLGTQYENMQDMARKGRAPVTKGEKCGKAKLTEKQVVEIIYSQDPGPKLAKRYGVNNTCIYGIKNGKRWAHIPRPPPFSAR